MTLAPPRPVGIIKQDGENHIGPGNHRQCARRVHNGQLKHDKANQANRNRRAGEKKRQLSAWGRFPARQIEDARAKLRHIAMEISHDRAQAADMNRNINEHPLIGQCRE